MDPRVDLDCARHRWTGLVARTIVVDISMPHSLQTAGSSRSMSKAPGDTFLKQLADDIKKIKPAQASKKST